MKSTDSYEPKPKIVLYVLEGKNGLPSVDPLSCQLLFLLKLHDVKDVEVQKVKFAASARLPKLVVDGHAYTNPSTIRRQIQSLYNLKFSIDWKCDKKDMSRITAYKELVANYIEMADLVSRWGTEENLVKSVQYYSEGLYYLSKFVYTRNLRLNMKSAIEFLGEEQDMPDVIEQVYHNASMALSDFSASLADKPYVFGDRPSTLDIYLVSYLAPTLLLNYPDSCFKTLICGFSNVEQYVRRFIRRFGDDKELAQEVLVLENDRASSFSIIVAGCVVAASMLGYAYVNGIGGHHH